MTPRGVIVESVSITDFNFSPEFARAIEAKQVAEQDALRAARELERARIEAQQQVARAEAEALRLQREVISAELLQLRFIERWDGVMPRFVGGENSLMPMLTIPSSEVLGSQAPAPPRAPAEAPAPAPANEQPATSP